MGAGLIKGALRDQRVQVSLPARPARPVARHAAAGVTALVRPGRTSYLQSLATAHKNGRNGPGPVAAEAGTVKAVTSGQSDRQRQHRRDLRSSPIGRVHLPGRAAEFNQLEPQAACWRETAVLFGPVHHMVNLFVTGPDAR